MWRWMCEALIGIEMEAFFSRRSSFEWNGKVLNVAEIDFLCSPLLV